MTLAQVVEELAAPQRALGVVLDVTSRGEGPEPTCRRNPGVMYGLANILDNAIDFSETRVTLEARWTLERVSLEIRDDGPGFSSEVLLRAGEPYVTTRSPERRDDGAWNRGGLGLGLFIAKTLIERSGAQITLSNAAGPGNHGAVVRISWARHIFERGAAPRLSPELTRSSPLPTGDAAPI